MLIVPPPERPWAAAENWLESPRTGPLIGRVLISSRTDGEPRRSSSAWPITATGIEVVFGVPAINEPVTTTSSRLAGAVVPVWALAPPAIMKLMASADTDTPQRYIGFCIFILPEKTRLIGNGVLKLLLETEGCHRFKS